MARRFGSAAAFKASLEANLKKIALERKSPFSTLQLKLVIERLLARLFRDPEPPWLLKGGFAMDLRFRPQARTTKDVDLSVSHASAELASDLLRLLRDRLQEAVDIDLGDYLTYRIGAPRQELTNAPRGGARYPCEAVLVGKIYAKFHIDVGCGDALAGEPERLDGDDLLAFAGIPPAAVMAISKPQQFAEKLHAYTFPWAGRLNTRTKDLVDLVLLIERGLPDVARDPIGPPGDVRGEGDPSPPFLARHATRGMGGRLPGDGERGGAVDERLPRSVLDPRSLLDRRCRSVRCPAGDRLPRPRRRSVGRPGGSRRTPGPAGPTAPGRGSSRRRPGTGGDGPDGRTAVGRHAAGR